MSAITSPGPIPVMAASPARARFAAAPMSSPRRSEPAHTWAMPATRESFHSLGPLPLTVGKAPLRLAGGDGSASSPAGTGTVALLVVMVRPRLAPEGSGPAA